MSNKVSFKEKMKQVNHTKGGKIQKPPFFNNMVDFQTKLQKKLEELFNIELEEFDKLKLENIQKFLDIHASVSYAIDREMQIISSVNAYRQAKEEEEGGDKGEGNTIIDPNSSLK